jgi:hypothetical protein
MIINDLGNVGIGTSSPTNNGATATTLDITGSAYSFLSFGNSTNAIQAEIQADVNGVTIAEKIGGFLRFHTSNTERMRITSTGNVEVSTGNLVIGTAGKGIDFSGNSDGTRSVSSNVLDDYEEGTWTPVIRDSNSATGTIMTTSNVVASYTLIGNVVTLVASFQRSDTQSLTGNLHVTGLPFTAAGGQQMGGNAWVDNAGGDLVAQLTGGNTSFMNLKSVVAPNDYIKTNSFGNSRYIYLSRTYRV